MMVARENNGPPKSYERIYREAQIGGGHVNADMQQFMEWDRKVLRFYAVLDDLKTTTFERRPFTLLFYLGDDTVEIREQYPLNCGRDTFPLYFRRGKMPLGDVEVRGPMDQARKKEEMVCAKDFNLGIHMKLMNNDYYVYDCDPWTREYFKTELGIELPERYDVRLPERTVPRPPTPPYTGYGSHEDSMGSVLTLVPKPPKKDFVKLFKNEGKVLRWTARFHNAKAEDADRLFVVNYYLYDDCLSIHEPPQRNIGIITGKFLEKAIWENQITGRLFQPEDMAPGKVIKACNRAFIILEPDAYTKKWLSDPEGHSKNMDLPSVLEKIREGMRQQFPLVRDVFRKFDTDHDGVITYAEFKAALERWGFQLQEKEIMTLMMHFDTRKDGQVSYNEFCDVLLDEDYTTGMLKTKPPMKTEFDPAYADRAKAKSVERAETEHIRRAAREIGDLINRHTGMFRKLFKEFSNMTHQNFVSCEQIQDAMSQLGHTFDLEDIRRCVAFVMPQADPDRIDYVEFLKSMVATYHDMCGIR
eukprot:gnl/TRDRNA2_/TRDRNA2_84270_c1_seq1.p1 gnl/TRDRNA2_/TRDRNA2_84270_c1~~gnl/TRDRNA2_/TRDRNA2_84270_c1_seq1.p1  ORF type:complete len:576 (-),score=143.73 gnl/TRDRNA2_/TRDRNA2_84270_c1_seq1:146-1732(-)